LLVRIRVLVSAAVLCAGLWAGSLTIPARTVACSCIAPSPLAAIVAQEPDLIVVVGRVGAGHGGRFAFAVERWYRGDLGMDRLILTDAVIDQGDGTQIVNTCGRQLRTGDRMALVGTVGVGGNLETNVCLPGGVIGTPDGDALVAEAAAALGPGATPAPPIDLFDEPDPFDAVVAALPIAIVAVLLSLGLLAIVAAIRRRMRTS
jgi:hypothetical protein